MSGFLVFFHGDWAVPQRWHIPPRNWRWIQVLDSLKIENYFYQNPKDCALILECLCFSYLFGFSLMINFCSRFPYLSKLVLSGTKQFWASIHLQSERCYFSRTGGLDSVNIKQSGKHLPCCSLKPHTFPGSCSKSPFKRLLFHTNKGGTALFNNLKYSSVKIILCPNGSTLNGILNPLSKTDHGN